MSSELKISRETTSQDEQIIKRFSMYIHFRDDLRQTGTTLVQEHNHFLKAYMTYLVQQEPAASEEYWSRFFLKSLVVGANTYSTLLSHQFSVYSFYLLVIYNEVCQQLLISYLQLICFYAARQMSNRLKNSPNFKLHYPLEECFVIACEASLRPGKLLKNFNFRGSCPLYGYARKTLNRTITNQVVKDFKIRSIKLSDYGLLNSLTPNQLEHYLKFYGIETEQILRYSLACQIFQELFLEFFPPNLAKKNKQKSTKSLSQQQLKQISIIYNQRLSKIKTEIKPKNPDEIQKILTVCIKAARLALQRNFVSLEDITIKLIDYNAEQLQQIEKRKQLQQLTNTILTSFNSLDDNDQANLFLWLGLEINQIDFIARLDLQQQYQVTRYFQRHQKNILKKVIQTSNSQYSLENISIEKLNRLCLDNLEYIKEYLQQYCKEFIGNILFMVMKKSFSSEEQEMIIQYVMKEDILTERYVQIYNRLKLLFKLGIECELNSNLSQFKSSEKYLNKFIKKWIQQNLAFIYQMR